jgi:cysteine sulfinate desulfinase/cysteine desulfurase-like protein
MRAIAVPSGTGTLRFSLSRFTTPSDIEAAVSALVAALGEIEGAAHICQR